jgi:hypothetical protein
MCLGIHLNLAMPGKDSTDLNIELALDECLTPFPVSLCSSEPFHSGSGENCVCGFSQVKFTSTVRIFLCSLPIRF